MTQRLVVNIHGYGFAVFENDQMMRGFYAPRRVLAETLEEAGEKALMALRSEENYQWLAKMTESKLGRTDTCTLEIESIAQVSWFTWHFTRSPKAFFLYPEESGSPGDAA